MDGTLQLSGGIVPKHIATCHADLYPGNVIMTADGPKIVDRAGAVRAPAALDLGIWHNLLSGARTGCRRQSAAAARRQCGRAVRVFAAGRYVPSGTDDHGGALPVDRPRLRPPRGGGAMSADALPRSAQSCDAHRSLMQAATSSPAR